MSARNKSRTLLALTSAALGLPGIAGRAQAEMPDLSESVGRLQTDYRYSAYREDKLSATATGGADGRRYEVDSHQFHLLRPIGDEYEVNATLTYETMSGASPWFITPGANGLVQVMSGATIQDKRLDLLTRLNRKLDGNRVGLALGYENEDDYQAVNLAADGDWAESAQRIWSAGLGYSDDEVTPTDGGSARFPDRRVSEQRSSLTAFGGVTQVLNAVTTLQLSLTVTQHDGFLSDPYKLAFVDGNTVNDSRPDGRRDWAALARLRHYFPAYHAALHLDYRYFYNDWEVEAHTVETTWHQRLGEHWRLAPGLRYYSQSQAYFYSPVYGTARADGYYASDYRLAPYGALSARIEAAYVETRWKIGLSYETYDSAADRAIKPVQVANPGLVDFDILALSLAYNF